MIFLRVVERQCPHWLNRGIVPLHEAIHWRQESAGTSCLVIKTGSHDILGFTIVFRTLRNPYPLKSGANQSIAGRKMLTLPVWPVLTFGGSAPPPSVLKKGSHQFCIVYNDSWNERGDISYKIGEAVMKIGGLEVALSQPMCTWPQWC